VNGPLPRLAEASPDLGDLAEEQQLERHREETVFVKTCRTCPAFAQTTCGVCDDAICLDFATQPFGPQTDVCADCLGVAP
jgi:hypothetical protein